MTSDPGTTTPRRVVLPLATLCLVLAACGNDGVDLPSDDPTTTGAVDVGDEGAVGFDELESAVVQIEATGTFEVPGEGAFEAAGRGSGFVVDPSGLTLTNNHVVTGAGTLEVWLAGERHNARVLGVSECLDLAVVDLEGEGFPYLQWREGEIDNALEVWAAGFPLGDPEFTITRGIVSKQDTTGASSWASLDHVIEHDARIRAGNSGGPLVDADGRVVGVNYAGDDALDFNFAIHRDEVLRVLERLEAGTSVLGVGINGQAWVSEDEPESGVFVASVAAGSPADAAGIEAGDLVTKLQGVSLAEDGTMARYCEVLRTHGEEATLDVEVYRPADGVGYIGQVNGEPLVAQQVPTVPDEEVPETTDREYVSIADDSGVITLDVPVEWSDVDGSSWTDDSGNEVRDVVASTDTSTYFSSWDVSGVRVSASVDALDDWTPDGLLDGMADLVAVCTSSGDREPYSDGMYEGVFEVWGECGGSTTFVVIGATAVDGSHVISVQLQLLPEDLDVVEVIISTFMAKF